MCGIYGSTIAYKDSEIKAKLERISFRGPDKLGFTTYNSRIHPIVFGHNRLAIIDLDPRSNQPFTYLDFIHIVFNGEIYNFKNIKCQLEKRGYIFKTTCDTEVLCAAYLEYGEKCVNHFNGMFTFVIYDEKKQQLFGARDRLGQKPFYYYHNKTDFEFGSQLSSIQLFNKNISISKKAISYYLAWGAVPDPFSIFNEIKKLKAGNIFTFNLVSGEFIEKPYWDIDYHTAPMYKGTYKEALNQLEVIAEDAVKIRLFADVPVGVFLSGGVDSSLIAALATKTANQKIKTFSVKFNEKGFDESKYATQVANNLKTNHHVIECNYHEGIDLIENFCYYYDEPFSDSSSIPSMLLAKYTRKHVTVALSGDGGDESFIGYHRYNWIKKGNRVIKFPYKLRQLVGGIMNLSPNYRHKIIGKILNNKDINSTYIASMTNVDNSWLNSNYNYLDVDERKYLEHDFKNLLERVSDFDLKTYLNWDINTKVDRASMAYSLEARAPLMDYRIVDFVRSLPTEFKFNKNNQKRILKDILYKYVPAEIFNRPKSGFTMPFKEWFRTELKDYVYQELNEESLKAIPGIKVKQVQTMIVQHMNGDWNWYQVIWKLLVLKQWLKINEASYSIK